MSWIGQQRARTKGDQPKVRQRWVRAGHRQRLVLTLLQILSRAIRLDHQRKVGAGCCRHVETRDHAARALIFDPLDRVRCAIPPQRLPSALANQRPAQSRP